MEVVLYTLLETLKQIGIILQPFLPLSSNYILNHLSVPADLRNLNSINTFIDGDIEIIIPSALFPRIENN
jgi:methionyl-tRNA synthetase